MLAAGINLDDPAESVRSPLVSFRVKSPVEAYLIVPRLLVVSVTTPEDTDSSETRREPVTLFKYMLPCVASISIVPGVVLG